MTGQISSTAQPGRFASVHAHLGAFAAEVEAIRDEISSVLAATTEKSKRPVVFAEAHLQFAEAKAAADGTKIESNVKADAKTVESAVQGADEAASATPVAAFPSSADQAPVHAADPASTASASPVSIGHASPAPAAVQSANSTAPRTSTVAW